MKEMMKALEELMKMKYDDMEDMDEEDKKKKKEMLIIISGKPIKERLKNMEMK